MTATSMARPRRKLQLLIETSPGRRWVLSVTPRIPSFSSSGARSPVSASLNTRFLKRLCLVILSPDFLQHPHGVHSLLRREHGLAEETGNGCAVDSGGKDGVGSCMRDGRKARHWREGNLSGSGVGHR